MTGEELEKALGPGLIGRVVTIIYQTQGWTASNEHRVVGTLLSFEHWVAESNAMNGRPINELYVWFDGRGHEKRAFQGSEITALYV